jgi:hypothetical protein
LLNRFLDVRGKAQPSSLSILGHQLFEPGFVDRHYPLAEIFDLLFNNIDAGYIDAEFREASTRDKSNVTGANYSNVH